MVHRESVALLPGYTRILEALELQFVKMPHLLFLGSQVPQIRRARFHEDRNLFHYFQTIAFQPHYFGRVVGHEPHFADSQICKHLSANAVVS